MLFLATTAVAISAAALALWLAHWRNRGAAAVAAFTLVVAIIANPLPRFFAFAHSADRARQTMLETAKRENCVGRSSSWLLARFGRPRFVAKAGSSEHWWYTPGPWYFVHDDYVGFEVRGGRVISAYMQVN